MKTLITNSFSVQSTFPSFNTAYLKGLLVENDIASYNLDINQKIWNALFDRDYIANLEYSKNLIEETPCPLCEKLSEDAFYVLKKETMANIEKALSLLRSEEVYEFQTFLWVQETINKAKTLIYHSYGTYFTPHMPYWSTLGFDVSDIDSIYRIANDKERNPLINIIEESIIPFIKENGFELVCIDIMFPWDIIPVLSFTTLLKKHLPDIHINYPGQGFDEFCFSRIKEYMEKDVRYYFNFDSVFIYRNDEGVVELAKNIKTKNFSGIENLYYIQNEEITRNSLSLDYLFNDEVVPNYDDIKFSDYLIPEPVLVDRLSYRCFWAKCSFCSINSNKIHKQNTNIERQISKIKILQQKYNIENFWFLDEGCTWQTALAFANALEKEDIKIYWSLRTRVNENWTFENLSYLHKMGLRELWIGLEHTNSRILQLMNKTSEPDSYADLAARILNDASEIGIGLHFCHIIGFPSEIESEREEVLNFYLENHEALYKKPFFTTFNTFGLMYNSPMYQEPEKFGINEINDVNNGFYMIRVPYKTKYNDDTNSPIQQGKLYMWIQKYQNAVVNQENLIPIWYSVADTPFELLFKKHYTYNPFFNK